MENFKIFEKEAIRVYMTTVLKLTEIFPRGCRYRPEMTFCLYCPNINTNAEGGKDCRRARLIGEAVNGTGISDDRFKYNSYINIRYKLILNRKENYEKTHNY